MGRVALATNTGSSLYAAALTTVLQISAVHAADPQPYQLNLPTTGNAELDQALNDVSMLNSLRETAAVGPFALLTRARGDQQRFSAALDSFGYYQAKLTLRILDKTLDDDSLLLALQQAAPTPPVPVTVTLALGPLFHLRKVEITGDAPEAVKAKLGLVSGAAANAQNVLEGRERLLNALLESGYALAKVDAPVAVLAPEAAALDVSYHAQTGPHLQLGDIAIAGLQRVKAGYVRRRLLLAPGDYYHPGSIEKARQDLANLGVFATVRVQQADTVDRQGRLPLTLTVSERPLHATSLGAAFATDVGGSVTSTWQHRNLFGEAEQFNLTAGVAQLGGDSTTGIGYKLLLEFIKPDVLRRNQNLQLSLGGVKQSLIAYEQKQISAEGRMQRKFGGYWAASVGLAFEQAQISQAGETHDYTLASLPLALSYDDSDSPLEPTQGMRGALQLTPVQPLAGESRNPFLLIQASAAAYFDLGEPGRSVLALRGSTGLLAGAERFDVPPDKRFYAGGSTTVRGFGFQAIGPQFGNGLPQGGTAMAAGTVEWRQRLWQHYGVALFADIGQAKTDGIPFTGTWQVGAGAGLRYYSPFGAIRADVGLPLTQQNGSSAFEVYIGLGQAF